MTAYGDVTRTFSLAERLERIALAPDETSRLLEEGELAQALLDGGDPNALTAKVPEGYAYYAVYPELYAKAAKRAGPKQRRRIVIGIRTIGTSLGAVVAKAVDADRFVTVRPTGDPFRRTLDVAFDDDEAEYFIVDEGPGLSGSSFVAVRDAIRSPHVWFLPSHTNGPGPQADEHIREVWSRTKTLHEPFVPKFDAKEMIDCGAGAWRSVANIDAPVWANHERRKYLLDGTRLAKFAGLGAYGREKLEKAQRLRGLIPPVVDLVDGFLVTEWIERAPSIERAQLLDAIGRYLLAVADLRAPSWRSGAHIVDDADAQPVDIDGRMHAWEWIATPAGDVLKCDALDHSTSHDGIGVQDLAWDVAGAIVEHGLTAAEVEALRRTLFPKRRWSDATLERYRVAYCERQHAIFTQAAWESSSEEAARLTSHAARYAPSAP